MKFICYNRTSECICLGCGKLLLFVPDILFSQKLLCGIPDCSVDILLWVGFLYSFNNVNMKENQHWCSIFDHRLPHCAQSQVVIWQTQWENKAEAGNSTSRCSFKFRVQVVKFL